MTIEFLCSHCSAHIRVPDRAGGRGGECPRCRKKIKVPKTSTLPQTPATPPTPPAAAAKPVPPAKKPASPATNPFKATAPVTIPSAKPSKRPVPVQDELEVEFASLDETTGEEVPAVQLAEPEDHRPQASLDSPDPLTAFATPTQPQAVVRKVKRRKRDLTDNLLLGLIAVVLLAVSGGAGYWWFTQGSIITGQVLARVEEPASNPKAIIRGSTITAPIADKERVLAVLQKNPLPLFSSVMEIYITSENGNLEVSANRTHLTQFVGVDIPANSPVRQFLKANSAALGQPHTALLSSAHDDFIAAYARQLAGKGTAGEIPPFRDSLALAQLTGPLGFHLVARTADGNTYRCVGEDGTLLWFLLPKGVKKFVVEGRTIGEKAMLPVRLEATVTTASRQSTSATPPTNTSENPVDAKPTSNPSSDPDAADGMDKGDAPPAEMKTMEPDGMKKPDEMMKPNS